MHFLNKCVTGNYINFAICEFYNDNTFTQLSTMIFQSIMNQDLNDVKQFKKLNLRMHQLLEEFFKKHLELIFMRFEFSHVKDIIEKILVQGIREEQFELKSCALITLDTINEFIYTNLKKPSKKTPLLASKVQEFYV